MNGSYQRGKRPGGEKWVKKKKLKIQNHSCLRPFSKGNTVLPVLEAPEVHEDSQAQKEMLHVVYPLICILNNSTKKRLKIKTFYCLNKAILDYVENFIPQ